MIERFDRLYTDGVNPDRGWPGDLIQMGYWITTGWTLGLLIGKVNGEVFPKLDNAGIIALIGVELMGSCILGSAGGFLTKRFIDRVLPESFAQKRGFLEIIQPHIRRLLGHSESFN